MPQTRGRVRASIGVTVKSGWASAVLPAGSPTAPRVVDSRRVELSDPSILDARQPYHATFGTARQPGRELSRLIASVTRFGRTSVGGLIREYRQNGHDVRGVGVVVGSLIDPDSIANEHIRIHALEGQLFRRVVEDAARRGRVPCSTWRERDLYGTATQALQRPEGVLRTTLTRLGADVGGGWRAEQKMATLAAWIVLAGRSPRRAAR